MNRTGNVPDTLSDPRWMSHLAGDRHYDFPGERRTERVVAYAVARDTLIMGLLELLSHRGKTKPVAASGHTADDS